MFFRKTKGPKVTDAQRALAEAQSHLSEVEAREDEVHKVAEESRNLRRNNHFAEDLQQLFGGGHR